MIAAEDHQGRAQNPMPARRLRTAEAILERRCSLQCKLKGKQAPALLGPVQRFLQNEEAVKAEKAPEANRDLRSVQEPLGDKDGRGEQVVAIGQGEVAEAKARSLDDRRRRLLLCK